MVPLESLKKFDFPVECLKNSLVLHVLKGVLFISTSMAAGPGKKKSCFFFPASAASIEPLLFAYVQDVVAGPLAFTWRFPILFSLVKVTLKFTALSLCAGLPTETQASTGRAP